MTARAWQAARRSFAAMAITALVACGGGGGGGGASTTTEPASPTTPTGPTNPTTPTTPAAQPGAFRTLTAWAGSADRGGQGTLDGQGTAARLHQPTSLAAAGDGSLWIGEPLELRVRRIDAQGNVRSVLEPGKPFGYGPVQALAAGPSGEVFMAVTHFTNRNDGSLVSQWAVMRIAPGAEPMIVALPWPGSGAGDTVAALALDRQGRLVIADRHCTLWRTDQEVLATTQARGAGVIHASDPANPGRNCANGSPNHEITRLALDGNDRVLFSLASGDVRRIEPDGRITAMGKASGGAACASMAVDRGGRLLLTSGSTVLTQLDATGAEQPVAGSAQQGGWFDGPAASARFAKLCAVAIDREGRIVLADQDNHTVRRIAADGTVSTVAGLAPQVGYRDGTGTEALFGSVFAVGPGRNGDVVVADPHNASVRQVDAQQRVSTLAGVPPSAKALMTADGNVWFITGGTVGMRRSDGTVRTVDVAPMGVGAVQTLGMTLDRAGDVIVAWGGYFTTGRVLWTSAYHSFVRYSARAPETPPQNLQAFIPAELEGPLKALLPNVSGLCVLPDGALAYTHGQAVMRQAADGTVSVLAGSTGLSGDQDGPAAAARFNAPSDLACDTAGGIYVADTDNHTVRYIDAQRNVRTVLGTTGRAGHRVDALPGELDSPRSLVLVPGGLVVTTGQGLVRAGF